MQTPERLLNEGNPKIGNGPKVPIEGSRRHPHGPRHLAEPKAAETLLLQQLQRGIQKRLPRLLLLRLADTHGVTHLSS